MDKHIAIVALCLLTLAVLLSGCTGEQEATTLPSTQNSPPTAIISTSGTIASPSDYIDMAAIDAVAYVGDEITFDASASYDPDGDISSYLWIWEDNSDTKEKITHRSFSIDNIYELHGLPLIYSIVLQVEDNNQLPSLADYRIGVIPKTHTFYFMSDGLQLQKPTAEKDSITLSMGTLRSIQTLTYSLNEPLWIQPCTWNITLFLEKPRYSPLTTISVVLLNSEGSELDHVETQLPTMLGQKKATIQLIDTIDTKEQFSSVQIQFKGFSLRERLSLLYGGEYASHIMFDFRI